ncbi:MAG: flagellar protein FlaG [Leptospiraceae bacterium]|nr:flagellar protein FlaG [Leptospiraceae bacterium]MCB1302747.1 flagellar protein FlaG [Leptospiraceae bacterium]
MEAVQLNNRVQAANSTTRDQEKVSSSRENLIASLQSGDHRDVSDTPENRKKVQRALDALDMFASDRKSNTRFQYSIHDETGTIQVKLYNFLTGEVLQEIPSSKLLEFASHMEEMSGLLLNEQA